MADEAPNPDETPITFNVKSSSDAKYVITVPLTTTVADLKQKLSGSDHADIPPDRQRLIYSGRVLKDPDTLASYKIKEGNTVHLVKGAASNQRQNPANTGASSTPGGAQPATGVPTNLAAGTGRDPLAGLTGARYAGYAQMPNANMFGPDGGMGPPPDPEQMASMLENPNFSSQLNEALSNPDVVEQMIRSNPMFQGPMAAQARQMLQDPNFRRMMTDPETLRNMHNMRRTMPGMFGGMGGMGGGAAGGGGGAFPMPGATDGAAATEEGTRGAEGQEGQGAGNPSQAQQPPLNPFAMPFNPGAGGAASGNPFAALFGGGAGPMGGNAGGPTAGADTAQTPQGQQQQANNPFQAASRMLSQNPQLMQQMMAAMGGGGGAAGAAGAAGQNPSDPNNSQQQQQQNPFAALQAMGGMGGLNPGMFGGFGGSPSPQPQDDRPPEDRFADQLRQLNDMGFYEFERNVEALRRTGGSVQGAVEYLLTH